MKNQKIRLVASALVAFCFYFGWAFWANWSDEIEFTMTLRSALVQGVYSGLITLIFTWILELALRFVKHWWQAPVLPILLQGLFVIIVNWINQTPNLWLTVAPSIVFSAAYGFIYIFALRNKFKNKNGA